MPREARTRLTDAKGWYERDGAYNGARHWLAGLIPETIFRPSLEFARAYARITQGNLRGAAGNSFHIYCSHDNLILALIFHWFGIPPYPDGVRYLEGLLMQVCDGGMRAWLRDTDGVFDLPYWWSSLV